MSNPEQSAKMWSGRFREPFDHTRHFAWRGLLFLLVFSSIASQSRAQQTRTFTLQHLALQQGERIIGFHVDLKAGSFESIAPLFPGWTLAVDNDPSWVTNADAGIKVGAAAIDPAQLSKVRFHLKVLEYGDLKFSVTGTVTVTRDFQRERQIKLSSTNILFE
jgi:hypothetical protein